MPARVLLAEDHTLVAEGFRRILEQVFEVIEIVADGESLVAEALRLRPDIVLIDVSLPVIDGFEAARRINREWPEAKIVFLTMHSDRTYLRQALQTGARGYLLKQSAGKDLLEALHEVLSGGTYIDRGLRAAITQPYRRTALATGPAPDLTPRQIEILRLLATGRSHDEIGAELGISPRTVKFHRSQIEKRLGVSGTSALTRYAINHGFVRLNENSEK